MSGITIDPARLAALLARFEHEHTGVCTAEGCEHLDAGATDAPARELAVAA